MRVRLVVTPDISKELAERLVSSLTIPVSGGEVTPFAGSNRGCLDATRGQCDANCLLEAVPNPEEGWSVVLLTGADLFLPALAYVFGLAHLGGRRGVVSSARLRAPRPGTDSDTVLYERLGIEIMHEVGHGLGLVHCPVPTCAMHRALWPESVDLKRPELCEACRREALDKLSQGSACR